MSRCLRVLLGVGCLIFAVTEARATQMGTIGDLSVDSGAVITPTGGIGGRYQNLLVHSEEFDDGSWVKGVTMVVTPNNATAPDESLTADTASSFGASIGQDSNVSAGSNTFTGSVWIKASGGTVRIGVIDEAGTPNGTYVTVSPTATWERYSVTTTFSSGTGTVHFVMDTGVIYNIWGAQLEQASTPGIYVKTTNRATTLGTTHYGIVNNAYTTTSVSDLRADVNHDGYVNFLDNNFVTEVPNGCTSAQACWTTAYEVDNLGNPLYGGDADLDGDGTVENAGGTLDDINIVTNAIRNWPGMQLDGTTTLGGKLLVEGAGNVGSGTGGLLINYTGSTASHVLFRILSSQQGGSSVFEVQGDGSTIIGKSSTKFKKLLHGTCSVDPPAMTGFSITGTASCTASGVTTSSRIWIMPRNALDTNVAIIGADAASGSITVKFRSTNNGTFDAGAANMDWLAIEP